MGEDENLKNLRSEMERLTLEIIRLSGERLALSKKIGEIKAGKGMKIEDPKVERELRNKVIELSRKYDVDVNFALKLLDLLIEESKRIQRAILRDKLQA